MEFSWNKIKRPIIALAPMAGYTDSPFRQIAKKIVPEIICVSELTSTDAIMHENEKTLRMLDFEPGEKPLIMQLFGNKPDFFVEAAKKLEQLGVAGIDINMGCPAKKITHTMQGSALLKDSCLAAEIVYKMSQATRLPVSVKTRLGFADYDEDRFLNFLTNLQDAGAKLVTLHGRTTRQMFTGTANWDPIYLAKKHLKIPVIGNGDITSPEVARQRLVSPDGSVTLDGLMIGRATFGNPWILAEIYAAMHGATYQIPQTLSEKLPVIEDHYRTSLKHKGERYTVVEMRKHLGSYIRGVEKASEFRERIMRAEKSKEVLEILHELAAA